MKESTKNLLKGSIFVVIGLIPAIISTAIQTDLMGVFRGVFLVCVVYGVYLILKELST
jgi:hypothetical protein